MEPIKYAKIDPNKNTTILVFDKFPRSRYSEISNKLMKPESVYAEQVGFVEKPSLEGADARLHMMGGEFCGNATASLGAYLSYDENLAEGAQRDFKMEVSGMDGLLDCRVIKNQAAYNVKVSMPLPIKIYDKTISYKGKKISFGVIEYPGIIHGILFDEIQDDESIELVQYVMRNELAGAEYSAKGVTLFSETKKNILPLIYVTDTDTEIWENSCGSASAALAAYYANKNKEDTIINILQPSGDYVEAAAIYENGIIPKVSIQEDVYISSIGTAFI